MIKVFTMDESHFQGAMYSLLEDEIFIEDFVQANTDFDGEAFEVSKQEVGFESLYKFYGTSEGEEQLYNLIVNSGPWDVEFETE